MRTGKILVFARIKDYISTVHQLISYLFFLFPVAAQHPKSLLVLCEDGLVVFDISEHGCPHYNVPFVLDLHKPAVTSLEYLDECPDNLTSSLCSVQSKQLVMDNVFKVLKLSSLIMLNS